MHVLRNIFMGIYIRDITCTMYVLLYQTKPIAMTHLQPIHTSPLPGSAHTPYKFCVVHTPSSP